MIGNHSGIGVSVYKERKKRVFPLTLPLSQKKERK